MRRFLLIFTLIVALCGVAFAAPSDSHTVTLVISPIAAMTMNNGGNITLTIDDAGGTLVGGATPSADTDATQYLQYTIVKTATATSVKITVGCAGTPPAGTSLTVVASGAGNGTNAAAATLTNLSSADLVTAIPNCATGTTATSGKQLTYTFSVTDVTQLVDNDTGAALTITYTIVEL